MHGNRERTIYMQARNGGQTHRAGDAIQISDPARDLRSPIIKASGLSVCLQVMRTDSKIRIYKTSIRPRTEVREDSNKTKSMVRVAEMKTL